MLIGRRVVPFEDVGASDGAFEEVKTVGIREKKRSLEMLERCMVFFGNHFSQIMKYIQGEASFQLYSKRIAREKTGERQNDVY